MDGPFPASFQAPSTWYADEAQPQIKSSGKDMNGIHDLLQRIEWVPGHFPGVAIRVGKISGVTTPEEYLRPA